VTKHAVIHNLHNSIITKSGDGGDIVGDNDNEFGSFDHFDSIVYTVQTSNAASSSLLSPSSSSSRTISSLEGDNDDDDDDGDGISFHDVPFDNEQEVVKYLKQSTHVLITIPPQQQFDDNEAKWNYYDPVLDYLNPNNNTNTNTTTNNNNKSPNQHPLSIYTTTILDNNTTSWIGYVSTTGVYGNHNGAEVDEISATNCIITTTTPAGSIAATSTSITTTKAYAYLDIERRWKDLVLDCNNHYRSRMEDEEEEKDDIRIGGRKKVILTVFRCAGLYGNAFSALHTVWKRGYNPVEDEALKKSRKKGRTTTTTSRIHLDDVGRAIISSMNRSSTTNLYNEEDDNGGDTITNDHSFCQVYNLADDESAPRTEVMKFAHELLTNSGYIKTKDDTTTNTLSPEYRGPPPKEQRLSERTRRRTTEWKRVVNSKMKRELLEPYNGRLLFPTFREGLASIVEDAAENWV